MKALWIYSICILFLSSSLCYPSSAENESSTSPNPGLFGYFGNLWKKSFWNSGNATTKSPATVSKFSRIHHVSRSTKIHAATESSTSDQPAGIFGHVKSWVNVIKDKLPLKMQPTTAKFLESTPRRTAHVTMIRTTSSVNSVETPKAKTTTGVHHPTTASLNHSYVDLNNTLKNMKRSAQTFTPLAETFSDGSKDSFSSEWISSAELTNYEISEEFSQESTSAPKAYSFTTSPTSVDPNLIESTTETTTTTSSNFISENTPESVIDSAYYRPTTEIATSADSNLNQIAAKSVTEIVPDSNSTSSTVESTIEITANWTSNETFPISFETTDEIYSYLEKMYLETSSMSTEESTSAASVVTSNDDIELQTTKKKRSDANANKLTPFYFTFFGDDGFAVSGSKREYRLPSTLPKNRSRSRRTRKHKKTSKRSQTSDTDLTPSARWGTFFTI